MNQQFRPRAKWIAWMCMIVYFASYIMRINFTVLLVKACSDMQVEKTALAVVVMANTAQQSSVNTIRMPISLLIFFS